MSVTILPLANQVIRQFGDYPDIDMKFASKADFETALVNARIPDGWLAYCEAEKSWYQADKISGTALLFGFSSSSPLIDGFLSGPDLVIDTVTPDPNTVIVQTATQALDLKYNISGATYTIPNGTADQSFTGTPDATYDKICIIEGNAAGTLQLVEGVAAESLVAPTLDAGYVEIYRFILSTSGVTDIRASLAQYVTLNTDQDIPANKTFKGVVKFDNTTLNNGLLFGSYGQLNGNVKYDRTNGNLYFNFYNSTTQALETAFWIDRISKLVTYYGRVKGLNGTESDDFTTKAQLDLKLDASSYNDRYKGKYTTLTDLQTAYPTANAGDYAQVDAGAGSDVVNYNYDVEDGWVIGSSGSGATDTDALPEGSTNLYFTVARVLATVLTGLSIPAASAIAATDTILAAFGKLQAQINDLTSSLSGKTDKNLTINNQTASYTLALTDNGKLVEMNVASANNLTIPTNASVAFPIGAQIVIYQMGAGQTTIVATDGVTLRQRQSYTKTAGQYALATLIKRDTDTWVLGGDMA